MKPLLAEKYHDQDFVNHTKICEATSSSWLSAIVLKLFVLKKHNQLKPYLLFLFSPRNVLNASLPNRRRNPQAVALDPALPLAVRLQLINSRRDLRSKAWLPTT